MKYPNTVNLTQMETINDWNSNPIQVVRSKGKSRTIALVNPLENLLRGDIPLWPPPEITQKLYQSDHLKDFPEDDHAALQSCLGFYCDLQSIRSEDAITWSCFGPIAHANNSIRSAFVAAFFKKIELPQQKVPTAEIWFWRRTIHPEKMNMGGPEIDFGIITPDTVLLGEAKWKSPEAKGQGINKDRGQIELRLQLFDKYWKIFGRKTQFVIVALSLKGNMVAQETRETGGRIIATRDVTWDDVASISENPFQADFTRYLAWKKEKS
jgi:hypothetical protein